MTQNHLNNTVNGSRLSSLSYLEDPGMPTGKALTEGSATIRTPHHSPPLSPISKLRDLPDHYIDQVTGFPDYLRMILTSRVYDVVKETPITEAVNLSSRLGCKVLLKREDIQSVFSFKIRGAYNKMANMSQEERETGVIACSAGNHAQGVAMSGKLLNIPCTIVMPTATPSIKYLNVQRLGSKVILRGSDFDECKIEMGRLQQLHGLTSVPPFDDPYVIAGQGTIGMEILRQASANEIDVIFCCVGGGGLISGIAAYVKRISPNIKVIGVETVDSNAMTRSLEKGEIVELEEVGLFADGAAVRVVGNETFRLCKEYVDEMINVTNDEICAAIKDVFGDTRSVVEPAGALAVAGLKKYVSQKAAQGEKGGTYVAVCSGANMNFDRLRFVAERAALGEYREVLLSVIIPEQPGSFIRLISKIHPRPITEFAYRFEENSSSARVFLSFYVQGDRDHDLQVVLEELKTTGMVGQDISDNEMAKSHARYLVGGRAKVPHERLYRFEFPERPGALMKFLSGLQTDWNVSLFHYRNHGADIGKVLVAIQVPDHDAEKFTDFLSSLRYKWWDETDNPVYKQFLL